MAGRNLFAEPEAPTKGRNLFESPSLYDRAGAALLGAGQSLPITDEIGAALGAAASYPVLRATEALSGGSYDAPSLDQLYTSGLKDTRDQIKKAADETPTEYYGGMVVGSLATGLAGVGTKAGVALGNSIRSGNLAMRGAKASGAGATSMGLYGFGSKEGGFDNRTKGLGEDMATGALLVLAAPIVGSALKATGSAIIPKLDTATKSLASRAKELGIDLRLDQLSPTRARRLVQKISQDIPLSGADNFEAKQQGQWMRGLSKTIGLDTDSLNPAAIDTFLTNANNKFGVLTKGKSIPVLPATFKLIDKAARSAKGNVTDDIAALVKKNAAAIKSELAGGVVNGNKLAAVRSNLIKRLPNIDPQARPYVQEFVDAMDVSVNKVLSKAERQTLGEARREWRNFKTIEPLLEKSTDGMINPTDLAARVASSKFIKASRTSTGNDDLVDLARIGKKFLPKAGGSDTQPKLLYGAGGAGAASVVLNPALALPVAATTGAVVGGNRAFQSGYNASQRLVNKAINATENAPPLLRGNASAIAGTLPPRSPLPPIIEGQSPTQITINPAMQGREGVPDVNLPEGVPQSSLPESLRENEGLRYQTYYDTKGNRTVGYGFNLDSGIAKKVWKAAGVDTPFEDVYNGRAAINDVQAEALGRASYQVAANDAVSLYPDLTSYSPSRQEALLDMSYHFGKPQLAKMEPFNAAVKKGDWMEAARQLGKTAYHKNFPDRSKDNIRKLIRES